MIENWNHFIGRFMASLRSNALGQFIMVLLTPWYSQENDTKNYVVQKKLETATPWSVIMLEHLISQRVGYTISIVLGDGQPINFYINGAKAEDMNYISAIINKHKLAGVSFDFEGSVFMASWGEPVCAVEQVGVQARWINPVCVKQDAISSAKWINPICVTELVSVDAKWLNPICVKAWKDDTITISVSIGWAGSMGSNSGLGGKVVLKSGIGAIVEEKSIETNSSFAMISFNVNKISEGYKVFFNEVKAYTNGAQGPFIVQFNSGHNGGSYETTLLTTTSYVDITIQPT